MSESRSARDPRIEEIITTAKGMIADTPMDKRIPQGNITAATKSLRITSELIRNPALPLAELAERTMGNGSDSTTLLILPENPLLVRATREEIIFVAPVLPCTRDALRLQFPTITPGRGIYEIVNTTSNLDEAIWKYAEGNPDRDLVFDPTNMPAVDYLGAAARYFTNEPFRVHFKRNKRTST